nr:MAG TPA: hypothetical protein [Caudoviricetes sp.]
MKITVGEILSLVDDARPNATSESLKLQFLNEVEAEIFDHYIAFKRGTEALIKPIHARAYLHKEKDELKGEAVREESTERKVTIMGTDPYYIGNPLESVKRDGEAQNEAVRVAEETEENGEKKIVSIDRGLPVLSPYTAQDMDSVVLLDSRFSGIYIAYLKAKIDFLEDEIESYANDVQAYQAEKEAWLSYMNRYLVHAERKPRGLI